LEHEYSEWSLVIVMNISEYKVRIRLYGTNRLAVRTNIESTFDYHWHSIRIINLLIKFNYYVSILMNVSTSTLIRVVANLPKPHEIV